MVVVYSGGFSIEYSNYNTIWVPKRLWKTCVINKQTKTPNNNNQIEKPNTPPSKPPKSNKTKQETQKATEKSTNYYQPVSHVIFLGQWGLVCICLVFLIGREKDGFSSSSLTYTYLNVCSLNRSTGCTFRNMKLLLKLATSQAV